MPAGLYGVAGDQAVEDGGAIFGVELPELPDLRLDPENGLQLCLRDRGRLKVEKRQSGTHISRFHASFCRERYLFLPIHKKGIIYMATFAFSSKKSLWGYVFVLDYIGVVSYYKVMDKQVVIKSEIETKYAGFCTLCGHAYEAGSHMAVLVEAPSARGKIAHISCVGKHNAKVEETEKRIAARREREAAEKLEWAKLTALAQSLKGK